MPTFEQLLASPSLLALMLLAALFVGLSKGGLPAIAMLGVPILSLAMPPFIAAFLLLPIYIMSDAVGVWLYRREYSARNIRILIPAGVAGVAVGWATAALVSDDAVALLIGLMGVSFVLSHWLTSQSNTAAKPADVKKGLFWGALSGFTSFVSHAGAPPFQVYVLPQKLPKMVFAGTTTFVFAAINLAKVIPYGALQPFTQDTLSISLLLLPAAVTGTLLGRYLTHLLPEKPFFMAVHIALFLVSCKLIINAAPNLF